VVISAFHPILYVADPGAERDFYVRFGFETAYEGEDFPGFIAVRCGGVLFGLSGNREIRDAGPYESVRWQFVVDDPDDVVRVCDAEGWAWEAEIEAPSDAHRARVVKVRSPNGVEVWFEGPNEADRGRRAEQRHEPTQNFGAGSDRRRSDDLSVLGPTGAPKGRSEVAETVE
jgi:catechol 2,3-dioxygenase-like lactoylglutathione lyase family enzyme